MKLNNTSPKLTGGTRGLTVFLLAGFLAIAVIPLLSWELILDPFPKFNIQHVKGVQTQEVRRTYPAFYDLRGLGKIPPKHEIQHWGHTLLNPAFSILESLYLPGQRWHFDRSAVLYHMTAFDHYGLRNLHYYMVIAALAGWNAPVDSQGEFYNYHASAPTGGVQKHMQRAILLPYRENGLDNDTVKWFISRGFPVLATYEHDSKNYHHDFFSVYGPTLGERDNPEWPRGAGVIVGWNDNFSRFKFKNPPPGDGVFILRHTFRRNTADNGVIYVSYYDLEHLKPRVVFDSLEDIGNYKDIYQYDPLGATAGFGATGTPSTVYWGANVFTAAAPDPLAAVSFYTNDAHTKVRAHIYKHAAAANPRQGTLAAVKEAVYTYPGYYTLKLDEPVPLQQGERFSVVIRFENSSYTFPLVIETRMTDYSLNTASANRGESFGSPDGVTWTDLCDVYPETNACIKAFTQSPPPLEVPQVSLQGEIITQGTWLLSKRYIRLNIDVTGNPEGGVTGIVIYKKDDDGFYYTAGSISTENIVAGRNTFIDQELEEGITYTYHAKGYTLDRRSTGRSGEIVIDF